jgi:DNA-binding beta-propeller fold protein YncE
MRTLVAFFAALSMHADVLLVANRGGSTITMIDPATMQILGTTVVGNDPHEIAVSADGRTAYVSLYANGTGNRIAVVDIASRTKIRDIDITPLQAPHGIAQAAGFLYFTAEDSQSVARYDPVSDRIDWTGRTQQEGTHSLAVKRDGSTVYTANIVSGTASVVRVTSDPGIYTKSLTTVPLCEGIALSPDEREVWTGSAGTGGIAVIDVATETVVARISPGTFAYRLAFTPDGQTVLVPRGNGGSVAVYDAPSRTLLRTIPVGGGTLSVLPAADNRHMYVGAVGPGRVLEVDILTGAVLRTVEVSNAPDGLAYAATPPTQTRKRRTVRP